MASRLNPYLTFDGNAREAMEHYRGVFGGDLTLSTFADFGNAEGPLADKIMHGMLETPAGFTLMGSDNQGDESAPGSNSAISLSGDDDALRGYWEKLSDGGTVMVPLEKQMWGDEFGMCRDRFGVGWMVNITGSSAGGSEESPTFVG